MASINWHDDGEKLIDGNSSISAVTLGSTRDIQFCNHTSYPRLPQHTVSCGNLDVMVMKPGCQERLVHRVCRNSSSDEDNSGRRIVISFRKLSADDNDPKISVNFNKSTAADHGENCFQGPATKVTVIAGDSHTVGLNADKLGRKGKRRL